MELFKPVRLEKNHGKNRVKRAFCSIMPAVFLMELVVLLIFPGCKAKNTINYGYGHSHDAIIYMLPGETITLELSNVPDGLTEDDYQVDNGISGIVENVHLEVTALSLGSSQIRVFAEHNGSLYNEFFRIFVYEFKMAEAHYIFSLDEDQPVIVLVTNAKISSGERVQWESSNPTVAGVNAEPASGLPRTNVTMAYIEPKGIGTTTITATNSFTSAACTVTITAAEPVQPEQTPEPDNILAYLADRADERLTVSGETVFVGFNDVAVSLLPNGDAGGGGKYMVLVDMHTIESTGGPKPLPVTPDPLFLQERLVDGSGFTSLLPPSMRASSMEDVSYIIRITDGEPKQTANYEQGVKGYSRVFEIRVEDALTGEILDVLKTVQGPNLPDKIYYPEGRQPPEAYYGWLPDERVMVDSVYRVLAEYWLEEYQNVVFFREYATTRYYGTGDVDIPESLGIRTMYDNDQNEYRITAIDRLILPDSIRELYVWRWSSVTFIVEPDSFAEEYCKEHEINYEYINQ